MIITDKMRHRKGEAVSCWFLFPGAGCNYWARSLPSAESPSPHQPLTSSLYRSKCLHPALHHVWRVTAFTLAQLSWGHERLQRHRWSLMRTTWASAECDKSRGCPCGLHGSRHSALPLPALAACSSLCCPRAAGSLRWKPPTLQALSPNGQGLVLFWEHCIRAGLNGFAALENSVLAQPLGNHL